MSETRWWKFVTEQIEGMTNTEAANKAGFDKSAFTRWKNGARADPEFVVKFARGFGLNVLRALVEAEFLTDAEADLRDVVPNVDVALEYADNDQLLAEIESRMTVGPTYRERDDDGPTLFDADDATPDNWRQAYNLAARTPDKDDPRHE